MLSAAKGDSHLSAIRGVAALVVLVAHVVQIFFLRFWGLQSWPHLVSSAASYYAVMVFFVLSGFLIAKSIELNHQRNASFRMSEFVAARLARLYPPFLVAVAISVLIYGALELFNLPGRSVPMRFGSDLYAARETVSLSMSELPKAVVMGAGLLDINGPLWSLYIEAKLYVIFACIYFLWVGQRSWLVIIGLLVTLWAGFRLNPEFAKYAAFWLIGSAFYFASSRIQESSGRSAMVMSIPLIAVMVLIHLWGLIKAPNGGAGAGVPMFLDLLAAMIVSIALFRWKLEVPFGDRIAEYSYSLYITHFPVLVLVQSVLVALGLESFPAACGFAVLGAGAALILARSMRWIELSKDHIQNRILGMKFPLVTER